MNSTITQIISNKLKYYKYVNFINRSLLARMMMNEMKKKNLINRVLPLAVVEKPIFKLLVLESFFQFQICFK